MIISISFYRNTNHDNPNYLGVKRNWSKQTGLPLGGLVSSICSAANRNESGLVFFTGTSLTEDMGVSGFRRKNGVCNGVIGRVDMEFVNLGV